MNKRATSVGIHVGKTKTAANAKLALSALSLIATLGGWANLSFAEHSSKQTVVASSAARAGAPDLSAEQPAVVLTLDLPALPTVTPLNVPTIIPASVGNPAPKSAVPAQATAPAAEPVQAAPQTLRVVSAPPRPKDGGGSANAPAPAAQTRSSK